MSQQRFRRGTDYKSAFIIAVNELIAEKIADRQERMKHIDALINEYFEGTGEIPNAKQIERLTDYILMEELTENGGGHKVTNTAYPFLSDWQLQLRRDREYDSKIVEETGTDGVDYKTPTRRRRTSKENYLVDKFAKSRNEERRKQYRKDTAPCEVISYKLT